MATFQTARGADRIITVNEAQQRILEAVRPLPDEQVAFFDALGRVLREDVRAPHDTPEADNSAMDGYAVLAADLASASKESAVLLRVIGDIPAGLVARETVARGTAMRIMTGALVPGGADCVVPVEMTDAGTGEVRVFASLAPGANIRRRGEDMRAGEVVLAGGSLVGPAELGILAGAQKTNVSVARAPVVAILSTGDELVDVGQTRAPGKVVDSNAYALAGMVREAGGIPRLCGIVRDRRDETIAAIDKALECDVVISSGGVSVGAYDFVKEALDHLGAETRFWRVAMKPGKPVVFARVRDRLYFGLPGNPVSSMVAFVLFVAPSLRKAMGRSSGLFPPLVQIPCAAPLTSKGDRRTYLRVRVVARDGELMAAPMASQGSHVSTSMLGANGLAVLEAGVTRIGEGDAVPVLLIGSITAE